MKSTTAAAHSPAWDVMTAWRASGNAINSEPGTRECSASAIALATNGLPVGVSTSSGARMRARSAVRSAPRKTAAWPRTTCGATRACSR